MPSVLEIICYAVIGTAVLLYISKGIYVLIDRKRHPYKYDKKEEDRKAKLDE